MARWFRCFRKSKIQIRSESRKELKIRKVRSLEELESENTVACGNVVIGESRVRF